MEIKMNKFVAYAAAGVLSVSALIAGQAAAQENENSAFAQMTSANTYGTSAAASDAGSKVGYGYNAGFLAKASHSSNVSIRYTSELSQAEKASFQDRAKADPSAVQALQAEIAQNADVVRGLQDRNVSVKNVIGAQRAADGSTTYIIR
jgi:long-subunit fatty acid transport protein